MAEWVKEKAEVCHRRTGGVRTPLRLSPAIRLILRNFSAATLRCEPSDFRIVTSKVSPTNVRARNPPVSVLLFLELIRRPVSLFSCCILMGFFRGFFRCLRVDRSSVSSSGMELSEKRVCSYLTRLTVFLANMCPQCEYSDMIFVMQSFGNPAL